MNVKLSARVRAGSECAPWVVTEIEKLERELAVAESFHKVAVAERDQLRIAAALNAQAGVVEALDELEKLQPTPQPQAEPVAWFVDYPGEMRLGRFFTTGPVSGARNTPLYAAPQPQASPSSQDALEALRRANAAASPQASAEDVALVGDVIGLKTTHRDFPSAVKAWQRIRASLGVGRE